MVLAPEVALVLGATLDKRTHRDVIQKRRPKQVFDQRSRILVCQKRAQAVTRCPQVIVARIVIVERVGSLNLCSACAEGCE